jgi:hypothetical protein
VDLRAEAKQRIERIARERRANSEKIARILKRVGNGKPSAGGR